VDPPGVTVLMPELPPVQSSTVREEQSMLAFSTAVNRALNRALRRQLTHWSLDLREPLTQTEQQVVEKIEQVLADIATIDPVVDRDLALGLETFLKALYHPEYEVQLDDLLSTASQPVYRALLAEKSALYQLKPVEEVTRALYRVLTSIYYHKTHSPQSSAYIDLLQADD